MASFAHSSPQQPTLGIQRSVLDFSAEPERQPLRVTIENCPVRNILSKGLYFSLINE